MKQQNFVDFYNNNYSKGSFIKIETEKNTNGYVKETSMVVRLVNHYNTKKYIESGKTPNLTPRPYEEIIIPHVLKKNKNTGNVLVVAHTIKNHKAHSKYSFNGKSITREEYYDGIGQKPNVASDCICINLDTIKKIG